MVTRPALVLTRRPVGPDGLLIWVAMITNVDHPAWPGDVIIPDTTAFGLIIPSKVRTAKVSTVETGSTSRINRLDDATMAVVTDLVRDQLGL